jgi:hypothetical protein
VPGYILPNGPREKESLCFYTFLFAVRQEGRAEYSRSYAAHVSSCFGLHATTYILAYPTAIFCSVCMNLPSDLGFGFELGC